MKYLLEYKRVSTTKQLSGDGMEQQTLAIDLKDRLCREHGLTPYKYTFDDSGVSAFKYEASERPAFKDMLQVLNEPETSNESVVVLYNWDRLSRQDIHSAMTTLMQVTAKANLYIMSENRMFSKNDPDLMVSLMMALVGLARAGDESKQKSKRTVSHALKRIVEHNEGKRSEDGYSIAVKSVSSKHAWFFDVTDGLVKPHKYYWNVAKHLAQLLTKGLPTAQVKAEMDKHYTPPKTDTWTVNLIRRFHLTEALTTDRTLTIKGTKHVLKDYYPRLLTEDEYLKLKAARSKRATYSPSTGKVNLVSGMNISKCQCGSPVGYNTNNSGGSIFCIRHKKKENDCKGFSMKLSYIEPVVLMVGADILSSFNKTEVTDSIQVKGFQLNQKKELLEEYASNAEQGLLPKALLANMVKLESEIEVLESDIETEKLNAVGVDSKLSSSWASVQCLPSMDSTTERTELKTLIKKSFKSITFHKLQGFSHFKVVFVLVNDHERSVVIKNGKIADWVSLSHPASIDSGISLVRNTPLAKSLGIDIEMISNLPIEQD